MLIGVAEAPQPAPKGCDAKKMDLLLYRPPSKTVTLVPPNGAALWRWGEISMGKYGFLLSTCAIGMALGTCAMAADMPVMVRAPAAPAAYDWTGCYIGGNGGSALLKSQSTYNPDPTLVLFFGSRSAFAVLPPSYDTGGRGSVAGGQIGCNFQSGWWVVGAEVDMDGANLTRSVGFGGSVGPPNGVSLSPVSAAAGSNSVFGNEQVSLRSLSTARARLGFTLTDRFYLYGTVGFALGTVESVGSIIVGVTNPAGAAAVWSGSSVTNKVGLSVGGGGEYAVTDHWSVKGEYIYFDLGRFNHGLGLTSNTFGGSPYPSLGSTSTRATGSIVRGGVNYKL